MEQVEISDFLVDYPLRQDPDFLTLIPSKKEFYLPSDPLASPPPPGEYYPHQRVPARYLLEYDRLLYVGQPGIGKTRLGAAAVEEVRHKRPSFKRCIWITKNSLISATKEDIIKQIQQVGEKISKQTLEAQRKRMITLKLQEFYEFMSLTDFKNRVEKLSDDEIVRDYSDIFYVFDESHEIRNVDLTVVDPVAPANVDITPEEALRSLTIKKRSRSAADKREFYRQAHRVFHLAQRIKILEMTGTVFVDSKYDIIPQMNLLLPANQQMNASTIDNATLENMKPYYQGRVFYLASSIYGANIRDVGTPIQVSYSHNGRTIPSGLVVERCVMQGIQREVYSRLTQEANMIADRRAFTPNRLYASGLVLPDGSVGGSIGRTESGLGKYIVLQGNQYVPTAEFRSTVLAHPELYSAKMARVLELVRTSPGCVYIYTEDVNGPGVIALSVALEYVLGMERFMPSNSASIVSGNTLLIPEKPRFALLTGSMSQAEIDTVIKTWNLEPNIDGRYIKVIIASRKAQLGFSLLYTQTIILYEPNYNIATATQAMFRSLRTVSYVLLRQRLGRDVDVNIYRLVAELPAQLAQDIEVQGRSAEEEVYIAAESKDLENRYQERILKQLATNCPIDKERNTIRGRDFSPECDYDICNYPCVGGIQRPLNRVTYDIAFSETYKEQIKQQIRNLFRGKSVYSFNELYASIVTDLLEPRFVLEAVAEMTRDNSIVLNRFGLPCFVRNEGDKVFLTNDQHTRFWTPYEEYLYIHTPIDMEELVERRLKPLDESIAAQRETVTPQDFDVWFDKLSFPARVQEFERTIVNYVQKGGLTWLEQKIYDRYSQFSLSVQVNDELRNRLREAESAAADPTPRRGKPPTLDIRTVREMPTSPLIRTQSAMDTPGDRRSYVYIHYLPVFFINMVQGKNQGYTRSITLPNPDHKEVRLYDPHSTDGFRDITQSEGAVYISEIKKYAKSITDAYQQRAIQMLDHKVYGIYDINEYKATGKDQDALYIVNFTRDETASTQKEKNTGKKCGSFFKKDDPNVVTQWQIITAILRRYPALANDVKFKYDKNGNVAISGQCKALTTLLDRLGLLRRVHM